MDQDRKYEEAIKHLSEGEFELSRNLFDSLLEEDPENPEYASGFYISSFWDHRIDRIHLTKEGRERTGLLLEFLKDFDSVYKSKSFLKELSYHSAMSSILQETTDQVRIALRKEGIQSLSPGLIAELAYRLLLAEDTDLASEVLRDSSGLERFSPELLFFRAECTYLSGQHSQGLLLYREAFLKEPSAIRLESVRSEPIFSAIQILREEFKEEGELKEALPVLLLERGVFKEIRKMSDKELEAYRSELFRLRDSLGLRKGGTEFKVKCRMIQLCCALLDSRTSILYGEVAQEAKRILDSLDPNLYHKRLKV
ncbi:hypothetical protein [Leptospira licerasiae]|uniref:Tetratricopeptide repeat protein n=1 Tax=Leptospira licerasiae str. MMD4847 TaxID=1049971 RepID=A0ABN0H5N8_9LEPT|nr:hypothetical protein [Leptospira licerasiae]EIE00611.1 hypothetical protein LEP1GSC185_0158 [Leptospira licerasiae serovar Varillal str. VAR 010]EJZ40886.1 hypothetical protein LEP1GSC178_1987 [Leptospira licerasiae str. MMD4847]TGM89350.1 hypothetical protein EHR05_10745 [Leptospira licerasiae]